MENEEPRDGRVENDKQYCGGVNASLQQHNGKPFPQLCSDDLVGTFFETLDGANNFYYAYAHAIGFSVRKDLMRHGKDSAVSVRQWCCSCEGFRKDDKANHPKRVRTERKETRTGCKAVFLVNDCSGSKRYVVRKFITEHNHDLVPPADIIFLRSGRNCANSDAAVATVLRKAAIRTCHAYEYMVDQAGGYVNVGFRIKDLYNKIDAGRREIMLEGDTEAALAYLNGRREGDAKFYCKFSVDEENRLCSLFWRDTRSLADYENYGDVLLFDSTYKTNCYEKPLVLFVGSSNHLTSVVFGCALLLDETIETYTWVLETFISSMNDKKPTAIVTDGDESMQRAIETVLPGCLHRLCSWHIGKNVSANVKDVKLRERFYNVMWDSATADEFEISWKNMIEEFAPKNTRWFDMMYVKRKKWAEAYCRGKFFARMRSTQRCEGMNRYVKDYLKSGVKLVELVPALVRAQRRLRFKYSEIDYNCRFSKHALRTQLRQLEDDASKIYTDNVFFVVRQEIERVCGLITEPAVQCVGHRTYAMWRHTNADRRFNVVYFQGENDTRIVCSCQKWEYEGIPCSHIFNVLKHEHISKIPSSLVLKRWTVSEKSNIQRSNTQKAYNFREDTKSKERFGYMSDRLTKLSFRASCSHGLYEMVREEIDKLEEKLEAMSIFPEVERHDVGRHENLIKDPLVVKTKGRKKEPTKATKKARQCSNCGGYGHNKKSCGKNYPSGPRVVRIPTPSSSSSDDESDGDGAGHDHGDNPPSGGGGPSITLPNQYPVHQFPIPHVYQYGGFTGMQNIPTGTCFNGMLPHSVLYDAMYPLVYGPPLFKPR